MRHEIDAKDLRQFAASLGVRPPRQRPTPASVTTEQHLGMVREEWTEEQFLREVLALAKECGWRTAHFRPARTARGWRTAVQGDGKGWPDVVMVRERIIFAELKAETGRLKPAQKAWIETLTQAKQEVYVWKPSDWVEIERVLREVRL